LIILSDQPVVKQSSSSFPVLNYITMDGRSQEKQKLKVGIVGAGLGGMMAAIAIAEAGAEVTILEAASELGEVCGVA
jgi:salicylate hydroxylase